MNNIGKVHYKYFALSILTNADIYCWKRHIWVSKVSTELLKRSKCGPLAISLCLKLWRKCWKVPYLLLLSMLLRTINLSFNDRHTRHTCISGGAVEQKVWICKINTFIPFCTFLSSGMVIRYLENRRWSLTYY